MPPVRGGWDTPLDGGPDEVFVDLPLQPAAASVMPATPTTAPRNPCRRFNRFTCLRIQWYSIAVTSSISHASRHCTVSRNGAMRQSSQRPAQIHSQGTPAGEVVSGRADTEQAVPRAKLAGGLRPRAARYHPIS